MTGFQAASTLAKLSEDKNQKRLITEIQAFQNYSEANALMGVERMGRGPRENKNKTEKMSLGKVSNSATEGFWRHVSAEFSKIFSIYTFSDANATDPVSF